MTVVAVTRNGLGDMWLFDSWSEADQHPIVQYGDVIVTGPEGILTQYTRLEIPDLLTRLGDAGFRSEVLMSAASPLGWAETMARRTPRMWDMMCALAARPPEDAAEIISVVRRDRKISITERNVRGRKTMNDQTNTEEKVAADTAKAKKAAKASKEPKEPKEKKEPTTVGGFNLTAKITLLCDKDGKPYGPDNNPKRPGSATHERFAKYQNGQTVKEAYLAGVAAGDFGYDVQKQFIKIDG